MLVKENIQDIYTLSPLQEGMFFHSLYEPASITYFEQQSFYQSGSLNILNVEKSLNELFKRYDILRTVFVFKKDVPLQIVLKKRNVEFFYEDLSGRKDTLAYINDFKEKDKIRFFDLSRDVLMRVAVFRINNDQFVLIWSWHHILMDAWCVGILKNDFFEIYNSFQEERPYHLPAAKPYRNFIKWMDQKDKQMAKNFWTTYLSGITEVSTLPKKTTEKSSSYQKEELSVVLDQQTSNFLTDLAKAHKVTLNSFILTVWGILLSKYNNTSDVVFGTVVSGRPSEIDGIESMVGLFINTLPVRVKYESPTKFLELLKNIQLEILQREEFNYCSLSEIQALSDVKVNLINHILLFQNFVSQNTEVGMIDSSGSGEEEIQTMAVESFEQYFYDFNLFIIPGESITLLIKYNGEVYKAGMVENVLKHLKTLISQITGNVNVRISELTLVSEEEKSEVLHRDYNPLINIRKATLKELFEQQVEKTPLADALVVNKKTFSYYYLNNLSNRIANHLIEDLAIGANDIVGVMLESSERLIASILGIIKAGATFLPIDPSLPVDRRNFIIRNSDLKLLLTDFSLMVSHEEANFKILALDIQLYYLDEIEENPDIETKKSDLAYIIYTSGSTGNPKGVKVSYGNFLNYILWANEYYFKNEKGKNFPLFTSLAFDLTLTSIFSPLLRGDKLFICSGSDVQKDLQFVFKEETEVTAVKLTPAHISLLGQLGINSTNVKYAIVGGEALLNDQVKILKTLNADMQIFNEYGPTEATVGCMVKKIEGDQELITIGKPIYNTAILILDQDLNIQPVGIAGEIYISGKGVAQGYLNDDLLSAKKFINNPFAAGEKLYKSGDLGRRLTTGEIEFLGRVDNQVKIRGYRVELGEIEIALTKYPSISKAVVLLKEDKGEKSLVAFIISASTINLETLRDFLSRFLPDYMVPSFFVPLESFPLNSNGKIDRKQLQSLVGNLKVVTSEYQAPLNPTQEKLAVIWKEVLGIEKIGIHDKFFDLGGHSLKAIQIISRIQKELNVKIEIRDIFDQQTINEVESIISKAQESEFNAIPVLEEQDYYSVSAAQERLLIAYQLDSESVPYNIPKGYFFKGELNIEALEQSFNDLIARHESLRTSFIKVNGHNKQKVAKRRDFKFEYVDLREQKITHRSEIEEMAVKEAHTPFALHSGPHLRVKLLHIAKDQYVFLLTMHHIISDKLSNEILIREILSFYQLYTEKTNVALKPLKLHYKDFAAWQNQMLNKSGSAKQKKYWHEKLLRDIPVLNFPTDYERPFKRTFNGKTENISVDNELTNDLLRLCQTHKVSPFTLYLACLKSLLFRYTNQTNITVGTVVSGREHPDLENQIGFYMNTLALNTEFSSSDSFRELLLKVKETTIGGLENQWYPFEYLIESLEIKRDLSRAPLFDILLSFQSRENSQPSQGLNRMNVEQFGIEKNATICDIIVDLVQDGEDLSLSFTYNTDLFSTETIQGLGRNYVALLQCISKDIDVKINDITFSLQENDTESVKKSINDSFNLTF